jgi:CheY-like chemotaxis protein
MSDFSGRRVLIIEDSPVVAPFAAELLGELGCEVVGPAPNMAAARELVENETIDAALLDVHIRGERVFPICDMLESRGIPFVLTSGYADWQIPEKWRDRPRLQKPYTFDQVKEALGPLIEA